MWPAYLYGRCAEVGVCICGGDNGCDDDMGIKVDELSGPEEAVNKIKRILCPHCHRLFEREDMASHIKTAHQEFAQDHVESPAEPETPEPAEEVETVQFPKPDNLIKCEYCGKEMIPKGMGPHVRFKHPDQFQPKKPRKEATTDLGFSSQADFKIIGLLRLVTPDGGRVLRLGVLVEIDGKEKPYWMEGLV